MARSPRLPIRSIPAVLELIARVVAHGQATGAEVSLCGDMAGDPACVPALLDCGLASPVGVARRRSRG